jgi:hypothetical protein
MRGIEKLCAASGLAASVVAARSRARRVKGVLPETADDADLMLPPARSEKPQVPLLVAVELRLKHR